ncbi:hypothetical protein WJ968_17625 [Achromobacter xylosoxidans]
MNPCCFRAAGLAGGERIISAWRKHHDGFCSSIGQGRAVAVRGCCREPAQDEAAPALAADAPAFDAGHYRSALG